ncbi:helix-turn-helix domain-containing protein [Xanthobacteraceae bacterium A53D]
MAKAKKLPHGRTAFGLDLEEAFGEVAAHLRGDLELEGYDVPQGEEMTASRIRAIRERVGSRKDFENLTGISARRLEGIEQGRRLADPATRALFRILDREPEAAQRALTGGKAA